MHLPPIQFSGGVSLPNTAVGVRRALIHKLRVEDGIVAKDVWLPAGEWRKEGKGYLLSNGDLTAYKDQFGRYQAAKGTDNEADELEKLGKMAPNAGLNLTHPSVRSVVVTGDYRIIKSYLSE